MSEDAERDSGDPELPDRGEPDRREESRDGAHEPPGLELDEVDVKNLLRRALDPPPERPAAKRTLKAVQKRIRTRSGGRFYADGWSTGRGPRMGYFVTAALMLIVLALCWFLLGPVGVR